MPRSTITCRDEIVDPEQIEDIVNMINDMGITVHEKAPDAESLLLTGRFRADDEEAVEEAAAALAIADAEFGRTTDPVRMYMREMGTVELLTREGEIRIAKRIEEGLDQVRTALAYYPPTYDYLLGRLASRSRAARAASPTSSSASSTRTRRTRSRSRTTRRRVVRKEENETEDEENDGDSDEEEEAVDTGPDPEETAKRFAAIATPAQHRRQGPGHREERARPEGRARAQAPGRAVHGTEAGAEDVRRADQRTCAATSTRCAASSARSWRSACARPACRARTSSARSRRTRPTCAGSTSTSAPSASTPRHSAG